jgi:hypothetical protein
VKEGGHRRIVVAVAVMSKKGKNTATTELQLRTTCGSFRGEGNTNSNTRGRAERPAEETPQHDDT